jgi:starch synthase
MISSEAAPLAKTGGLADVVGALPAALHESGDEAAVIIPRYGSIELRGLRRVYDSLPVVLNAGRFDFAIYQKPAPFPFYLADCPALFGRPGIYGDGRGDHPDNHIRFAAFCRAALSVARSLFRADIIHGHDWQAGPAITYLKTNFATDPSFIGTKALFTIHNIGYQGIYPRSAVADISLDSRLANPAVLEFYGNISYLKAGIVLADAINTVSPTYAREIQTPEYGYGMDGVLRSRSAVLSGIVNGADYEEWNPATDSRLPATFSSADLSSKRVCKESLMSEMGLDPAAVEGPLIGLVSRFAYQKGIDLITAAAPAFLADGCTLAVLGSGDSDMENDFRRLQAEFPGRVSARIGFDNGLAHRIEAGADMFLMPSRYEPCGLNQIYSLRYGTVPVVRATGGLDDTIEAGTGFKFAEYSSTALLGAVREAVEAFADPDGWQAMMRRGMAKDFSWTASAGAYSALYHKLLGAV